MSAFRKPRQARARITFDKLLDAASLLLGEVGIERISSNLICERAGVTPPAFYRYFDDKYAILAALAERLMERQNVVLEQWTGRMRGLPPEQIAGHTIELIRDTALVGDGEPGIRWILGALRAVPRLTPIRLESHAAVTQLLLALYQPALPHVPEDVLRRRIRMSVEFGYMLDEMIREEAVDREQVWQDAVHVFAAMATYPDYAPA